MLIPNRGVLAVSGEDRESFLQGLITNDMTGLAARQGLYSCLLTAQGRFLHDFFVVDAGDRLLLDCEADRRDDLAHRLKRFRLRARVEIADETETWQVHAHSENEGSAEGFAFPDPRTPLLGYRCLYSASSHQVLETGAGWTVYDRLRISLAVPDGSRDMVPEEALLLENNIDRLHGISWTKGCYVGQELTARMHYKGGVKRLLTPVRLDGPPVEPGIPITLRGKQVGEMRSCCGDVGLALLRVDADARELQAGATSLSGFTANDAEPD